jgi:hypothetical protein
VVNPVTIDLSLYSWVTCAPVSVPASRARGRSVPIPFDHPEDHDRPLILGQLLQSMPEVDIVV